MKMLSKLGVAVTIGGLLAGLVSTTQASAAPATDPNGGGSCPSGTYTDNSALFSGFTNLTLWTDDTTVPLNRLTHPAGCFWAYSVSPLPSGATVSAVHESDTETMLTLTNHMSPGTYKVTGTVSEDDPSGGRIEDPATYTWTVRNHSLFGLNATVTGTNKPGYTLTAHPVAPKLDYSYGLPATGVTYHYQWRKNGVAISGANAQTYAVPQVPSSKAGDKFTVTVTATRPYTDNAVATSSPVTLVAHTLVQPTPTISGLTSGKAKIGKKLTANHGTVRFDSTSGVAATGLTFTYKWYAGSKAIAGATKSTFTPTTAQKGKALKVTVTVTSLYAAKVSKSSATAKVTV